MQVIIYLNRKIMEDNQNIENINVINIENKNENQQEKIDYI